MSIEITMPKLSDTMEEGTILKWRIKEGDRVAKGDIIAEVETDKAAMEMEAFEDGEVASLRAEEGQTVAVGTVIAVFGGEGEAEKPPSEPKTKEEVEASAATEEVPAEKLEEPEAQEREVAPTEMEEAPAEESEEPGEPGGEATEPKRTETGAVSPAARRLARERGVDLDRVRGSGPGGRVVLADVERAAEDAARAMPARERWPEGPEKQTKGGEKSVKIRRIVARKMVESWQNIPHFFVTVSVDMTDVIKFRKDLKVSVNDFILAAVARSLLEHPWVNSLWGDGEAVEQKEVNLAMAVATDRGLYNPVIKDCGPLSLKEISRRAAEVAERAHQGKLRQEDMEGGTFTISNMGMLGVESFSAIITPPQAAVLAVGTIKGEVVVDENGEPGIAPILRLTLSADHRILDGADAAEFMATLKSYLEAPVTLVTCNYGKEDE